MNPLIGIFVRHGLTVLGGWLTARGILDASGAQQVVDHVVGPVTELAVGAVATVGGVVLSVADKVQNSIFHINGAPKSPTQVNKAIASKVGLMCFMLMMFAPQAQADTLRNCSVLMDATSQSSSTNGTITLMDVAASKALSIVSTATNVSGTAPTLDVKVQTCRTTSAATCKDLPTAFPQCTAAPGSCYDSTGYKVVDFSSKTLMNTWKYYRAVTTLAGTAPVYNVKVEICTGG